MSIQPNAFRMDQVRDVLEGNGELTSREIAEKGDMDWGCTRAAIRRMVKNDIIEKRPNPMNPKGSLYRMRDYDE